MNPNKTMMLTADFFNRAPLVVAKELLGKVIYKRYESLWLAAMIVETEAYYLEDKGSHASLGRTPKRQALFMPAGTIYMYYARGGDSLNISCRGEGNAVLIKAGIPYGDDPLSLATMHHLNPVKNSLRQREDHRLCAGQTLLCKALNIKVPEWNQRTFDKDFFYIADVGYRPQTIVQTVRLGIPQGRDEHLPYRFIDTQYAHATTKNQSSVNLSSDIKLHQWITKITPRFIKLRRQIHTKPELGYQEKLTATLIARELKKMGLAVNTEIGGTGVVAVIDSGKPGKTLALRAELDALPMTEMTSLSYQSIHSGKMHACGHDGHTATLLMAAEALCHFKNNFKGKIKLIFQPAEEMSAAGAAAMIKAGVLENPAVDAIFAYHNYPGFPVGTLQTREGTVLSGNTDFTITLYGKGGHAASPDLNLNPIFMSAILIKNLHDLQSKLENGQIIGVTEINGGCSKNIIPDSICLGGTLRYSTLADKEQLQYKLTELVKQTFESYGARANIEFIEGYPPTINSTAET
ncbi:MAG: DNA-3-methyladenine glycosylase, partial [Gammaproteobacteria bacterium]|nr:DNA-3-methyladenine glycosylase [Gammaproteobacteria bacterium]MBY0544948.1 DNA-3-methyladenine glycosylase [Gammaproteobacteria bacterium]